MAIVAPPLDVEIPSATVARSGDVSPPTRGGRSSRSGHSLRAKPHPGECELAPEELANIATVPDSLAGALDALEADHDFLTEGGVFSKELIETWIDYKRTNEIDPIRLRPHPHEFELYYDI